MKDKPKIIAMYLPQFHQIPENDEFWGKGFTDWVTVKNARPLFPDHEQPKVPLDENYYDLSVKNNVVWQAKIAKENGVYGFGIYHYWFNNEKNLLTKPAEIIRDNADIDINYFFCWDNNNWKRSWSNVDGNAWAPIRENVQQKKNEPQILIPYVLGNKPDWKNHFDYLKSFFLDERYIKVSGKPVFCIFGYSPKLEEMTVCWDQWAREIGFDGVYIIYKYLDKFTFGGKNDVMPGLVKYNYEPIFHGWYQKTLWQRIVNRVQKEVGYKRKNLKVYDYDEVWRKIIRDARDLFSYDSIYHGGFVAYDDTPRRGERGIVIKGSTPQKFEKYLRQLFEISAIQNKDFIFLTAWNEWGEGAYLEPDTVNGYAYLEAIKRVTNQVENQI